VSARVGFITHNHNVKTTHQTFTIFGLQVTEKYYLMWYTPLIEMVIKRQWSFSDVWSWWLWT